MNNQGIEYKKTGEARRGEVCSYHYKPDPLFLNKTKHNVDIAGLKKKDRESSIKMSNLFEFESRFTIGFEVEKNELNRGAVKEYELFCGFERDGSCGYEAVTHVLPLLPNGKWKTKVFDMMLKAEKIIDDRYSPSDRKCGGHITIACDGLTGVELMEFIRQHSGIVLALFRKRLTNAFCGANRRLQTGRYDIMYSSADCSRYNSNGYHSKYQTALMKDNCVEFRVPSKFESVKQMMRRYELFYELINFSVNSPNRSHSSFLKRIEPIILSMYNGDKEKTDEILQLSKSFQNFINKNKISDDIKPFLG